MENNPKHRITGEDPEHDRAIYDYVIGMDEGDIDAVEAVIDRALDDPELARIVAEVNAGYREEMGLAIHNSDAEAVRQLLEELMPTGFKSGVDQEGWEPLTVSAVVMRMLLERRVGDEDREASKQLRRSSLQVPNSPSKLEIAAMATQLGVRASERFWRSFRETAIMLALGRSHSDALKAAARGKQAGQGKNRPGGQQGE